MGWELLIPLIAKVGLEVGYAIWQKASAGQAPTDADWQELLSLANQSAADRLRARLLAAGIDPDSDQGKLLLGLVPP